jgi:hypothetical protein
MLIHATLEKVQNGSDIAVLLLGYTDEMLAMVRNQKPRTRTSL